MTHVAFAGLSPLREGIVRAALGRAGRFEVIEPWTSLAALRAPPRAGAELDILFIELADPRLPDAVRAMLSAASRLRIVALAVDATWAKVFEMREHQTVLLECVADDLCTALAAAGHEAPVAAS